MTVEIFLSDFQGIVYGVFRVFISTINVQFSAELFFCCLTVECLHFHFTDSLCICENGIGMTITQWESRANGYKN